MAEVLQLGKSFDSGRQRLNAFFSATTEAELLASGVSINRLVVGSLSASTIYSAGTELSTLINTSAGPFRREIVSGTVSGVTNYLLHRDYQGNSSVTSTLYVTGHVSQFSVDFLPVSAGKVFKLQWYNQSLLNKPSGYFPASGQIQFNNFDISATTETFSMLGGAVGEYQYLNDPSGSITYNGTQLPGLDVSGITATFYPISGSNTPESAVTRVYIVKGLLM